MVPDVLPDTTDLTTPPAATTTTATTPTTTHISTAVAASYYASSTTTTATSGGTADSGDHPQGEIDKDAFCFMPLIAHALEALQQSVSNPSAGAIGGSAQAAAATAESPADEAERLIRTVEGRIRDAHDLVRSLSGVDMSESEQQGALDAAINRLAGLGRAPTRDPPKEQLAQSANSTRDGDDNSPSATHRHDSQTATTRALPGLVPYLSTKDNQRITPGFLVAGPIDPFTRKHTFA
ncbi:hypothetical protein DFJ77DRAFT_509947 [Powellomyces hirtus]|nr:hypothetical protein DFJ77DRAFT_509947 [Powellomyces hirtus]